MEPSSAHSATAKSRACFSSNNKGPAPLASFDEISVLSLDVSSPTDKGKIDEILYRHEIHSSILKGCFACLENSMKSCLILS